MSRPPLPPFTVETAAQKVRMAEDAWNARDPARVALAYTEDSEWRNRAEFVRGRAAIEAFLTRKWHRELDYRLIKELWAFRDNRIAVRFAYEWHDDSGNWFRSYGNENWEFDEEGLMRRRIASINDLPIAGSERKYHWPLGRRPDDHPGLSDLGLLRGQRAACGMAHGSRMIPHANREGTAMSTTTQPASSPYLPVRDDWLARRTEAILEPELPIVDPHHHLWERPGWVYMLDDLLADTNSGHNIVATVFVQCRSMHRAGGPEEMRPVGETEFVNGVAAMSASGGYGKTKICAGIVGHADLRLGSRVRPVLEAHIRAGGGRFRGIRHITAWDADPTLMNPAYAPPPGLMADATFRQGFSCLAPLNLTFRRVAVSSADRRTDGAGAGVSRTRASA